MWNPRQTLQRLIGLTRRDRARLPLISFTPFIEQVARSMSGGRLTVFVGAGASYASGFPTWTGLLQRLSAKLVGARERGAFEQLSLYDSPLVSARFLKTRLAVPEMFHSFVHDALYDGQEDYDRRNPTLAFLMGLVDFAASRELPLDIITYNLDDLLDTTVKKALPDAQVQSVSTADQCHLPTGPIRILHVHGFLPKDNTAAILPPPTMVLSEDDFHKLMNDHTAWENQVQAAALAHRDCLFVGMSMTDPNLRRVIDFAERYRASPPPTSRWITAREYHARDKLAPDAPEMDSDTAAALNDIKSDLFRSLGAEPIYIRDFGDYDLLAAALKKF